MRLTRFVYQVLVRINVPLKHYGLVYIFNNIHFAKKNSCLTYDRLVKLSSLR